MGGVHIYIGRHPESVPVKSVILFPVTPNLLCCGLAGIIAVKGVPQQRQVVDIGKFNAFIDRISSSGFEAVDGSSPGFDRNFLGGPTAIESAFASARDLKKDTAFLTILRDPGIKGNLSDTSSRIDSVVTNESYRLKSHMGKLGKKTVDIAARRIEALKDISWCIAREVLENVGKVDRLLSGQKTVPCPEAVFLYKKVNAVLNSINRLEVRGRDSAGISLLFIVSTDTFEKFQTLATQDQFREQFQKRVSQPVLANTGISVHKDPDKDRVAIAVTYKVAAEIGKLGDNIRYLRKQISEDPMMFHLAQLPHLYHTVSSHTRWASVGEISEPNCHPVDNSSVSRGTEKKGIIHACLNGDIDNYLELKSQFEDSGEQISSDITTDTKIIPLQIEKYIGEGHPVEAAFRLAMNDFEGSHAIAVHTDLAPGKFFLGQRGSGQSVFIGMADGFYMPASEVYGFIEETSAYIKMEGEKIVDGSKGKTQGQVFILDQRSAGGIEGLTAMQYDGTTIKVGPDMVKHTDITSRDIDRQDFPHYFMKEISEAPESVEKTLLNRWKQLNGKSSAYAIALNEGTFPASLKQALSENRIKRVLFIGQGTAGIAAAACSDILHHYLNEPSLQVKALKASELSGFGLGRDGDSHSMDDTLVVAISQSGTTTDTNRTVDMVRERGAHTLAIVNRRDSDITFKVDGVFYTSSGRDIEMSVASTKAFYAQIIAGALLSLQITEVLGKRNGEFISAEIQQLLNIPAHMRSVLNLKKEIRENANKTATTKTYWAVVGSGPNKTSADEIRIKLSELCYKTISSDYVEDKKHIDLSSEPLIIVAAAGTNETVVGDIIKDTAIFKAHKATPIVIANEGETRFAPYAEDVFHVPAVSAHLAPILNTLVGHIWGYYAALAINAGSTFLHDFREDLRHTIRDFDTRGIDLYEVVLEKSFREKIAQFYTEFRRRKSDKELPVEMAQDSDLTLLLKYLAGRLPVSDFELDFEVKGTARNMIDALFGYLGNAINQMSRPVDAIKHQAKTVTVGTSRISEKLEGILFETLEAFNLSVSQLINRNIIVLRNLQAIVSGIKGSILYKIEGLNLLGEPTESTVISILRKEGILQAIPSRVETDTELKGTKRIIVKQGNVYIGKGRKDGRSILVIPLTSNDPTAPSRIEYLLLLNIGFKEDLPLATKIKALGGKYDHIKNIIQEHNIPWEDEHITLVATDELFGRSAEKLADIIINNLSTLKAAG
ncbi:MAG: SIS domain-containing protein [Desulfobacteraceae bacterium]|nr:SIS domain-containing protein [Desulfobacteraceae bacterium]